MDDEAIKDGVNETERLTYSVPEAGAKIGLGKSASYEAARRGDLPTIRMGRRLFVPVVRLKRMLEGQ